MSDRQVRALDLFAGPGGFDLGARDLGLDPLGIEWDDAACATREAAGLRTLQADVATLDPADFAPCDLLVASPPCQAWSMAGQRKGEQDIARVHALTRAIAGAPTHMARNEVRREGAGNQPRSVDEPAPAITTRTDQTEWMSEFPDDDWADPRSRLVTEPIRWIKALHPTFVALEQVPPVLDYWHVVAGYLREWGYAVWTGVLSSERYGVPQTRKRAILMASLDGPVHPPRPTHQAYVPGEPARHEHTLEGELLPWVSMAEALEVDGAFVSNRFNTGRSIRAAESPAPTIGCRDGGGNAGWQRVNVPAPTVTAGGSSSGGPEPFGRGGARADQPSYLRTRGAGMSERHDLRDPRPADEPAPAVTGKARSDEWVYDVRQDGAVPRGGGRPAPTICAQGLAKGRDVIRRYVNGNQPNAARRDEDQPAPTVHFGHALNVVEWVSERPATTVAGDPRHKKDEANPDSPGRMENAVRVTIEQAAALQSFPPGHPWKGDPEQPNSRSKQFQCIGNAVPPLMAFHILRSLALPADSLKAKLWAGIRFGGAEDCWEWQGATNEHGYGVLRGSDGRNHKAHRVAMGEPDEFFVLHRCDNPPCCNPRHLFLGTQADNIADMHAKGRGNTGSVNGQSKLTEADVRAIRERVAAGESQKALCAEYGISKGSMSALVNGKTWKYVA